MVTTTNFIFPETLEISSSAIQKMVVGDQGNISHFDSWPYDPPNIFYWRKSDFRVDFWMSSLWSSAKLQNILSFCVSFWRRLWLQKPVENFLCVVRIRFEYVKHSPRSGEYSALWIMTVRRTKHFLFDKVLTPLFPGVWTPLLYLQLHMLTDLIYRRISTFPFEHQNQKTSWRYCEAQN